MSTHNILISVYKKISLNYPKSGAKGFCSKGLQNEFETAVLNKPSVFEPLKFYCISLFEKCCCLNVITSIKVTNMNGH